MPARERFVRGQSWGHHASCTARIGYDDGSDRNAVVDGQFRVRHVRGLRVVDASIFPRIPGYFVVVPVYMASEKASDDMLEEHFGVRRVGVRSTTAAEIEPVANACLEAGQPCEGPADCCGTCDQQTLVCVE